MDPIDRRLIELLRTNARFSYAELARQVGLSAPAVHERVGKLEAGGIIQAYRAVVDPESVGLGVTALIGIVKAGDEDIDDAVAALYELPEIESCYFLAGEESFLVKVRVSRIAELEQLIVRLHRLPVVASTRTAIALSIKWEGRPQPLPGSPP